MKRTNQRYIAGATALMLVISAMGCRTEKQPAPGDPLPHLTPDQLAEFEAGKKVFQRVFSPEEGLGPLFNANSCAECHERPALGGIGDEIELHATRSKGTNGCDPLFPEGGPVIQQHATPLLEAKGIKQAPVPAGASTGRRSTPPLFGLGLVDAIPDATILSNKPTAEARARGVSGHANRTIDGRVGRFGRKALVPTLLEFNAGAFLQEMGITTPFSPLEKAIGGMPIPPETDPAPDPEIGSDDIQKVVAFVSYLAPPPRLCLTNAHDRVLAKRGQRIFAQLACGDCHVSAMRTGPNPVEALDRKAVALYSDLLVHDLGPDLADICLGQATPSEFRTAMLMGLRFRDQFLHDGSAATVTEAIERHAGEAAKSSALFKSLSDEDKRALLKFLDTL